MSAIGTNFAASGMNARSSEQFPDPFADMASTAMPTDWKTALKYCEFIVNSDGTYRSALDRIISYFLTEIEIIDDSSSDTGEEEKDKWLKFCNNTLHLLIKTKDALLDCGVYGNSFSTVMVPFKRMLACPKCGSLYPLQTVYEHKSFGFEFRNFEFIANCPICEDRGASYRGPWIVHDEPADEENAICIKQWNPHEIEILYDPYSGQTAYLWRIPEDYKQLIRKGHLFHLERVSKDVLEAIKRNLMFRFHDDAIFHMREPSLSGINSRGWGISRVLINYRQAYYLRVLKRLNEAIALDYVIPFRLITPVQKSGSALAESQDLLMNLDSRDFTSKVRTMLRHRRQNPAAWFTLPYPVQYQALGGDASQLAPVDLINQGEETLLAAIGTPAELYRGTLQLQAAPVALRLFQSTFAHVVHNSNQFINWAIGQAAKILSWEAVEARFKRVTIADDIDKTMMALQMAMAQQISGTSALSALGYDWKTEQKRLTDELQYQTQLNQELQKRMEEAGLGAQIAQGQPAGGGQAAGGGGQPAAGAEQGAMPQGPVTSFVSSQGAGGSMDPQGMIATAEQIADELLGLPESLKDSELRKLKQHNQHLHVLVKEKMDEKRQESKNMGGAMLMQQTYGGGQQAA